jgi:hypothetical protein
MCNDEANQPHQQTHRSAKTNRSTTLLYVIVTFMIHFCFELDLIDVQIPVSVKMRLGLNEYEKKQKCYLNVLKETNADSYIIHARHGRQVSFMFIEL